MRKYFIFFSGVLIAFVAATPFVKHTEFTVKEAVVCKCLCIKCLKADAAKSQSTNEWEQGEFVTLRRIYPHARCGGQLVFNGQATPAPYSEKEFFYNHVCDLCGVTNQILNATWPQFKQEWRRL